MLLIVPPSETKRAAPASGPPVDLASLSFPELDPTRRRVADALVRTSADLDAFQRLGVRSTLAHEVARNVHLFEVPALPVLDVYTGPLHDGLAAARLSMDAAARARRQLVVTSALWGALRPTDRIPPYRLHLFAHLIGLDRLASVWREVLPNVLADAAGAAGVVVDLRSPHYQSAGLPSGIADRLVTLRVSPGAAGARIGDVVAKRSRGEAAHELLESGADPGDAHALADVLARRWPVRLELPEHPGVGSTLTLTVER